MRFPSRATCRSFAARVSLITILATFLACGGAPEADDATTNATQSDALQSSAPLAPCEKSTDAVVPIREDARYLVARPSEVGQFFDRLTLTSAFSLFEAMLGARVVGGTYAVVPPRCAGELPSLAFTFEDGSVRTFALGVLPNGDLSFQPEPVPTNRPGPMFGTFTMRASE